MVIDVHSIGHDMIGNIRPEIEVEDDRQGQSYQELKGEASA